MKLPKKNKRRSARIGSELDSMSRIPTSGKPTSGKPQSNRLTSHNPQRKNPASGAQNPPPPTRYRRSSYQGNRQMSRGSLAGRTPMRRAKKRPEERPIFENGQINIPALKARVKKLAKDAISGVSIDREDVIKAGIIAFLMIFFALLQTTVFTRLPPFGAVPDMMLSFAIAVAVSEGEKGGAVVSLFCALVISSLGSVGANELPLVYLIAAYISGIMSHYYLRQNALIRLMYQVCAGFLKGIGTLVMFSIVSREFTLAQIMVGTIIPEYFSTLVLAPAVHVIVWLALRFFHRSRAQRTEG